MNELKENIKKHIDFLCERYPALKVVESDIATAYRILEDSYKNGGKLLVAGNGGSAADAEHIVGELMKGFKLPRKPKADFAEKLIQENAESHSCSHNDEGQDMYSTKSSNRVPLFRAFFA